MDLRPTLDTPQTENHRYTQITIVDSVQNAGSRLTRSSEGFSVRYQRFSGPWRQHCTVVCRVVWLPFRVYVPIIHASTIRIAASVRILGNRYRKSRTGLSAVLVRVSSICIPELQRDLGYPTAEKWTWSLITASHNYNAVRLSRLVTNQLPIIAIWIPFQSCDVWYQVTHCCKNTNEILQPDCRCEALSIGPFAVESPNNGITVRRSKR